MRSLVDVNVLLALCYAAHEHHITAMKWLDQQNARDSILICRMVQLGLCRLLSNEKVMGKDVLSASSAWKTGQRVLTDERFHFLAEPPGTGERIAEWVAGRQGTSNLWTDLYLAAVAKAAGLQLVSFDRGFRRFAGLQCRLL